MSLPLQLGLDTAEDEPLEFDIVERNGKEQADNVTGPNGDYVRGAPPPPHTRTSADIAPESSTSSVADSTALSTTPRTAGDARRRNG